MSAVFTAAVVGVEAVPVQVETDVRFGLPNFFIVGLPDAAVKEAKERIRAAARASNLDFPDTRVTVNLAPADLRKQGPAFDLPIALSVLGAQGVFPPDAFADCLVLGELGLDGSVRPVRGALAAALLCARRGFRALFVPERNAAEAAAVRGVSVRGVRHVRQLTDWAAGKENIPAWPRQKARAAHPPPETDFAHIRGQAHAKRALEIAAAGGHNVLLNGPPGTGKTLLARALPGILPPLSEEEAVETTVVASVAGLLPEGASLMRVRPFRHPHHSSSAVALVGGGAVPRPGEVSLAHRGVLFLDELPEFQRRVLEQLRQPMEDGDVTVARAHGTVRFPARCLIAAAMNPCPCGFASDPRKPCVCSLAVRERYRRRVSGPLLDRFDVLVEVPLQAASAQLTRAEEEPSEAVRKRVMRARTHQQRRGKGTPFLTNADIPPRRLDDWCALSPEAATLLSRAADRHVLSGRAVSRLRKVARTIADLAGGATSATIEPPHIAEALHYRLHEA